MQIPRSLLVAGGMNLILICQWDIRYLAYSQIPIKKYFKTVYQKKDVRILEWVGGEIE